MNVWLILINNLKSFVKCLKIQKDISMSWWQKLMWRNISMVSTTFMLPKFYEMNQKIFILFGQDGEESAVLVNTNELRSKTLLMQLKNSRVFLEVNQVRLGIKSLMKLMRENQRNMILNDSKEFIFLQNMHQTTIWILT